MSTARQTSAADRDPAGRSAFVTGATGFVGGALCRQLVAGGWDVMALARTSAAADRVASIGATPLIGDILDPSSLSSGMPDQVDVVFHVAGDTSLWHKRDAMQTQVNVEGTRNVLRAAHMARARRFVLTSTLSAYGPQTGVVTEDTPSHAAISRINYERSKWQAEAEVRRAAGQGMDTVILQPGAIIGPGDADNWGRMFRLLAAGQLPFIPPGRISFNHVDAIADAHVAAALKAPANSTYLLGGYDTTFAAMVADMCALLGRRPPGLTAPASLLHGFGRVIGALTPKRVPDPLMTAEMAALMSADTRCDSRRAQTDLGLRFTDLQTCLADCHAWLVKELRL